MNTCPCCSELLLRYARHNSIYWFCTHCWQEMPNLTMAIAAERHSTDRLESLSDRFDLVR